MVYRKGERPIEKRVRPYTAGHPVAEWLSHGDEHWLNAWVGQMGTTWERIVKVTGIPMERIEELAYEDEPNDAEIEALAALWYVPPEGLRQSIEESRPYTEQMRARLR